MLGWAAEHGADTERGRGLMWTWAFREQSTHGGRAGSSLAAPFFLATLLTSKQPGDLDMTLP